MRFCRLFSLFPTCEGSGASFSSSSHAVLPAFLAFPHLRRQRNVLFVVFANSFADFSCFSPPAKTAESALLIVFAYGFAGFSCFSPPAKAAERPFHRLRMRFCRLFSLFPTGEGSGECPSHRLRKGSMAQVRFFCHHLRHCRAYIGDLRRRSPTFFRTCATISGDLRQEGREPAPRGPGTCAKRAWNLRHETG